MNDCDTIKPLLMGLMDGELTPDQLSAVNRHLLRCDACRREYDELRTACDPLRGLSFEAPDRRRLERLWRAPYSRLARNAGLAMVLAGWLTLMGFAAISIATDRTAALAVKLGLAGIGLGLGILLLHVLIDRLATWRRDPYKEVE